MRENESQVFSSNDLEKLFSSNTVILFRCDSKEGFPLLSVSENVKEILGFKSSYFLEGENRWSNRIHPDDKERVLHRFEQIVQQKQGIINEYRFKRKDGTYIWLRDELKLVKNNGDSSLIYGSSIDITERKKAELALKESKEQYQSVVDHIKDITYSINPDGEILFLNSSWEERTGYTVEETKGSSFWNYLHPEDIGSIEEMIEDLIKQRGESAKKVVRIRTKNGSYYWVDLYAKSLKRKTAEGLIVSGTISDVSDGLARLQERAAINKQLEKRVQQHSEDLREEIKKRRGVEKELNQRLRYEQALSKCSSLLLEHTNSGALEESLKILREVTQSDRVYISRNVEVGDKLCLEPLIEVTDQGTEIPKVKADQLVSYSEVPWWYQKLSNNEIINTRVDDLPDEEGVILQARDVNAVLVIPISIGEEWFGYIGFADNEKDHLWDKNEVRLLQTAADIISAYKKRKKIEKNLIEHKNYTEAILNSLPSIYLLVDEELDNVQWNASTKFFTGYSEEELAERSAYDLIVPEHHNRLTQAKEKIRNNEGGSFELTLLSKLGRKIPYYWRGYYIKLNNKHYYIWVGIDITRQKETEQALVDEKRFNEALVETLPGCFYMIDEEGQYQTWNQNLIDEFGYTDSELKELSPLALFSKSAQKKVVEFANKVFEDGEASVEVSCLTKTGQEIPYLLTGKLFRQEGKDYLLGVGHNITEQVEAREKLRKNEELFRNLFLQAPSAIVMVTPDNEIKDINRSFEKLFGYSIDEIKGKDIDKVLVPEGEREEAPTLPAKHNRMMASFHREAQRRAADGSLVDVFVASIPVVVDGKPIAGFGMYIDITEQKKYEEEIYSSLKEKHVLLQEIHHRVKNNLAVVSGLIQLQMYETDDEEVRDTLRESESRIQTMALIHEKLYKSQRLSEISCQSYIGDLLETIRSTNNTAKDITLEKKIDAVNLSINQAVPFALLINEVVTNAFKHAFKGQEEGNICITLQGDDNMVKLSIQDNGIGLPEDFKPRESDSLGMTLIYNFMDQLEADGEIGTDDGTYLNLTFEVQNVNGSSASSLLSSSYGM
ncbi:PAS domain S-box protein [Fodinibius halophilus]|uniref:histidine kinase n=1 Tax=Fodinibius halophilus TaxID=1736908 RepID=A0A6M1T4I2_9BACT|nr:PAS domain S-box protein [Fodinibius halophilus]NGP88957.1 PAS domain S-box protein [Fodinibius halophilus]